MSNLDLNYLSYSGWYKHETCAFAFWNNYLNRTPIAPDNRVNSLFGSIIGKLNEVFYKEKLWRDPNVLETLLARVEPYTEELISEEIKKGGAVDFTADFITYKSKNDLVEDIKLAVLRMLRIIKHHQLIGSEADAEVKLDWKERGLTIAGRCDIMMVQMPPHNRRIILDGKGSKYREKYVDANQLKWYAFLYRRKYNATPDALGFVYWRSEPEDSVDWIKFTSEDLDKLESQVMATIDSINEKKRRLAVIYPQTAIPGKFVGKQFVQDPRSILSTPEQFKEVEKIFEATPATKRDCEMCPYLSVCEKGTAKTQTKKKRNPYLSSGVTEIGLDDDDLP